MARMIQITCKIDGEPFLMTPRKGNYPTVCEAHKSAAVIKSGVFTDPDGVQMWALKCRTCKGAWYKPAAKARKPVNCYNCTQPKPKVDKPATEKKPAASLKNPTVMRNGVKYQILHCESGNHMWERKSLRGKAPRHCAETHDGSPKKAARSPEASAAMDEQMKELTENLRSLANTSAETRLASIEAARAAYTLYANSTLYTNVTATIPADKPKAKRARKPRSKVAA